MIASQPGHRTKHRGDIMRLAIHRNLQAMATNEDKSIHVWSKKETSSTGNSIGHKAGSVEEGEALYALNPTAHYNQKLFDKTIQLEKRHVSTWICGDIVSTPIAGKWRRCSINPLPPSRTGGRAERQYMYSDTRLPVKFSDHKAVCFTTNGCWLLVK